PSAVGIAVAMVRTRRQQADPSVGSRLLRRSMMRVQPVAANHTRRIVASLPFVEALARRMAATMPNSIDVGDLVQDGVLGLIDAVQRFDQDRGIKFETFAERRVRGAMIDALRRDAWPRGVRRQRRELDAAREALRRELGHEPSMADLAARVGSDEKRLSRTIVRINTIESTSPMAAGDHVDGSSLPPAFVAFAASKTVVVKAPLAKVSARKIPSPQAVVLPYKPANKRPVAVPARLRMSRPRQAVAAAR